MAARHVQTAQTDHPDTQHGISGTDSGSGPVTLRGPLQRSGQEVGHLSAFVEGRSQEWPGSMAARREVVLALCGQPDGSLGRPAS